MIDDTDSGFSTEFSQDAWQEYRAVGGQHYGDTHYFNTQLDTGQDSATWSFTVPKAGRYEVYAWWWEGNWRPADVPYTIHHLGGSTTVRVNQRTNGGQWNLLGAFDLEGQGSVTVSDDASSGQDIVADAVRLVYRELLPSPTPTSIATDTPVAPTATPVPPTATPVPVPPTATPAATSTLPPNPNELVIDDTDSGFSTQSSQDRWKEYKAVGGQHYGDSHYFNTQLDTGQDFATWSFTVPKAGRYEVYAWWWDGNWRPADVPYTIHHLGGSTTVRVNQRTNGGQWNLLGAFDLEGQGSVTVSDDASSGQDIVADAVRLVYREPLPYPTPTPAEHGEPEPVPLDDILLTGTIRDALTSQGISGATFRVFTCVSRKYATETGPDGRYSLLVRGSHLKQCGRVTLLAWASGYQASYQRASGAELIDDPQRDLWLLPWSEVWSSSSSSISERGDVNGDSVVDLFDLVIVSSAYDPDGVTSDPAADANRDGVVDLFDLVRISSNFGLAFP